MLLRGYARSPFRDFEKYHRIVVDLVEDKIQLILKQDKEEVLTYEMSPGIYSIKDISDAVYTMGDQEGTLKVENDEFSKKTKPFLKRFGGELLEI